MTSFVDARASDAAAIVAEQGIAGVYNPLATTSSPGTPVDVTFVFDPLARAAERTPDGRFEFDRALIQTLASDTPSPDTRDTFTVGTMIYAVLTIEIGEWIVQWTVQAMAPHAFGGEAGHVQR